jgi:transcriptional regulator of acetoin/glycerol metabolism
MAIDLTDEQLKVLARHGARLRLAELEAEIRAIRRAFPSIRAREKASVSDAPKRRRWNMSAAARKAASERMKKYWAARRASARK